MSLSKDENNSYFIDNLNTIANIKAGNKLYIDTTITPNMIKIDDSFMLQGIWRYYNNISRKDAIYILNKIYSDIEMYINTLVIKDKERMKRNNTNIKISNALSTLIILFTSKISYSIAGIEQLQITYANDVDTCEELNKIKRKGTLICESFSYMI
uniref:Uncharacterized protein n=1 Tax=viral metagenome TaxID=1070528 RepID=A0A6C0HM48_9ZZZZ